MQIKVSRLKVFRIMSGKSQSSLAHEIGLTQPYISMLETNKAIPTKEIRERLAAAIGIEDSRQLFPEEK